MKEKIEESKEIIRTFAKEYKNPIIYCGFGKDSMVMLHLCRDLGFNWPVMYHRDSHFPKKARWANHMIEEWDVVTYDYPPTSCGVFYENGVFEIVRDYQIGEQTMALCASLYEPTPLVEGEYLCALKDIYRMPKGTREYPWDLLLVGHRKHESKPHTAGQPNQLRWVHKHILRGADCLQPLREWTNQEVYEYTIENGIPWNDRVYEVKDGEFVPKEDSTYNPDRRPACYRCFLPFGDGTTWCPRLKTVVNNLWDTVRKIALPNDYIPNGKGGGE